MFQRLNSYRANDVNELSFVIETKVFAEEANMTLSYTQLSVENIHIYTG